MVSERGKDYGEILSQKLYLRDGKRQREKERDREREREGNPLFHCFNRPTRHLHVASNFVLSYVI